MSAESIYSGYIQQTLARLIAKVDLSQEEARLIMDHIMSGHATEAQIGSFLTALHMKGETVAEIAGSAQAMRAKALHVQTQGKVVDTCGTGGDHSGTFNISTTAAFVVAACGIKVAKHGNRSISSKSGSADVLRVLGVNIEASLQQVERCLAEAGIGFLFAPKHHEAMRHALGPRRELGFRTIFNLLGPLTNPASAQYQVIGVFDGAWTAPMAQVLGRLGAKRALVVHGSDGLDEITLTAPTLVSELAEDGSITNYTLNPQDLGLDLASPAELLGGDPEENAGITHRILIGEEHGPKRTITVLNAGAALYICGIAESIQAGLGHAAEAIDSGQAFTCLERLIAISNDAGDL